MRATFSILLCSFLFSHLALQAQPTKINFDIPNAVAPFEGDYIDSGLTGPAYNPPCNISNDCICYNKDEPNPSYSISFCSEGNKWARSNGPCGSKSAGGSLINGTDGGCESLTNAESITDISDSIPTLSQWGYIILGLSLTVLGVVAIRQKVWTLN